MSGTPNFQDHQIAWMTKVPGSSNCMGHQCAWIKNLLEHQLAWIINYARIANLHGTQPFLDDKLEQINVI